MCGFAGRVSLRGDGAPPSRELLARMAGAIAHRGPDGFGLYRDAHAGLVHARLSIVDLAGGDQPMTSDGWWVVFNGELFNYVALRDELVQLGRRFRTHSDTEVVLQAFAEWGTDCFHRFNGQWALALWHPERRALVLSRDPIGICPLFVHEHGASVAFASEMKALLADPSVPRELDPRAIDQTFTYWGALAPVTSFAGIDELPPGSFRTYCDGQRVDGTHWSPSYPPSVPAYTGSLAQATDELRTLLEEASQLRVSSADVPVGCYLSGGLDSSLIAHLGRSAHRGEFRTFSLRFADEEFDEGRFQRLTAAQLDSRHDELVVSRADIAEVFPEVVRHTERPLLRTAPAPMFLLSREVRAAGVKAVLTGEGADEFAAGYDLFREARIRRFWARRPSSEVRPLLFDRIYPYLRTGNPRAKRMAQAFWQVGLEEADRPGFSHGPRWRSAAALQRFYSADFAARAVAAHAPDPLDTLPAEFGSWHPLAQAQYLEITTLLSPYIISSQGDRQLLGNGVEGRFPFLDPRVMSFLDSLPPAYKLAGLDEKHVLKCVARGVVAPEVLARKKQPYRAPDALCFTGADAPAYVTDMLSDAAVRAAGVFEPAAVQALHRKLRATAESGGAPSNADNMAFVGVLSTQLLHHHLVVGAAQSTTVAGSFSVDVDHAHLGASERDQ